MQEFTMRKLMMMAAAATALMAVPASAGHVSSMYGTVLTNTAEMRAGYATMDECMSAFRQLRNDQRKSGMRGGEPYDSMSNGEYNRASRMTTRCEELQDDRYYIVFNGNGFSD
jgi:hypothetical protein